MTLHLRAKFERQRLVIDGQDYDTCAFVECRLLYNGGEVPRFSGCDFVRCGWDLGDAAMRTIGYLAVLRNIGAGHVVDKLLAIINSVGELPAPDAPIQ